MIYSVMEIAKRIKPVADKYGLKAVYLFGSYARGNADENSDIDLIVDTTNTGLDTLFKLGGLYSDLEDALGKNIDLITVDAIFQPSILKSDESFKQAVWNEKVELYGAA